MKKSLLGVSTLALLACAGSALAQTAPDASVSEVIVTGTRQIGIKAADSSAPIQLVGAQQLIKTGSPDLATALSSSVPSLDIQTSGGDAAAVHILASLRGLSPNDTLILVDGQRRHSTSNLAVDTGSIYSGSATTDLNYIPVGAIDHIEVLTDGASAQYGTDAIAGVINIILKKNSSGGIINGTGGAFYNQQGATQSLSFNQGFNLNDKGYLNLTLEERTHNFTTLGFGDYRLQSESGALNGPFLSGPGSAENQNVVNGNNYPHENRVYGDPEYAVYNSFFNAGYHISDEVELYGFGNYSYNTSQHFENYRLPTKVSSCLGSVGTYDTSDYTNPVCVGGTTEYAIPNGFDPKEKFDETDYSITAGAKGTKFGWDWDVATTYGENSTQVYVLNTANASEYQLLQTASSTPVAYPTHTIYDGSFDASEWSGNLALNRSFQVGLAAPLDVALGLDGRRDTYGIGAGEPESYFGSGSQSFFGYSPQDAGNYSRTNYGVYFDFATNPIKNLKVDLAGRYENYSDFGQTHVGKVNVRYDLSPMIAFRGTISDGFRAPTLAEEHYTGINVGPSSASLSLAPNSSAADAAGFTPLKPEQSINYSAGFILHPISRLQITVDAYYILLHDRIIPGSSFKALEPACVTNGAKGVISSGAAVAKSCPAGSTAEDVEVSPATIQTLKNLGITTSGLTNVGVSAFLNAANTRTDGVDITATYASDFGEYGHVDWSAGFNYNHTQISLNTVLPPSLYANYADTVVFNPTVNQTNLLNQDSASALTTAPPREKLILQGYWTKGPWTVNLRETVYNGMSEYVNGSYFETIPATAITDVDVGYQFTHNLRVDIGANNLFNTLPPLLGTVGGQPADGNYVYKWPYAFAPWGQNGGYYYGRVVLTY